MLNLYEYCVSEDNTENEDHIINALKEHGCTKGRIYNCIDDEIALWTFNKTCNYGSGGLDCRGFQEEVGDEDIWIIACSDTGEPLPLPIYKCSFDKLEITILPGVEDARTGQVKELEVRVSLGDGYNCTSLPLRLSVIDVSDDEGICSLESAPALFILSNFTELVSLDFIGIFSIRMGDESALGKTCRLEILLESLDGSEIKTFTKEYNIVYGPDGCRENEHFENGVCCPDEYVCCSDDNDCWNSLTAFCVESDSGSFLRVPICNNNICDFDDVSN